uniref:Uncharacterized protein n=1 Tax=Panagrolaimus superbus TaxID=310955 RepID=A0A914YH71_9BILA
MLSYGREVGIQLGNDVELINPGPINLTLTYNELDFEVCTYNCRGNARICFESLNGLNDTDACSIYGR